MLAATGFASTATGRAAGMGRTPVAPPAQGSVSGNPSTAIVHWDKFYDRQGNLLSEGSPENVGADSLYFKNYYSTTILYGCPKSQVPNPNPANCRPAFAWLYNQTTVGMDPAGTFCYEVYETTLRRHNTNDGSHVDFTIPHGYWACGTDGNFIYAPVKDTVYKYTLAGTLVSTTVLDLTPVWYEFSVVNDTVWCGPGDSIMHGYACSKFTGGSITTDATWNVGSGSNAPALVGWDGQYYYVSWDGYSSNTFKRFNADRTLSASGTINIDTRGVMCSVRGTRPVTQDSLYWKLITSTINLYSSFKAQNVTAAQPTPLAWQYSQSIPCMTPNGHYVFEVCRLNMRRTDLVTGDVANYALADSSGGACGTDGRYVYVPKGTTTRKYDLDGTLVSATTTDYAPWTDASTFGFGVANDTVWIAPDKTGPTWYGYACSKFTGGSITHDATWSTSGGSATAMTVNYDGQYYYMTWGGYGSNTFLRFYRDRTLYSTGTVTGDARSVMCRQGDYPVMVCDASGHPDYMGILCGMLVDSSGGRFAAVDTYNIGSHATFPATEWYNHGYRAILALTNVSPADSAALGDSLARFVQLGGGVVEGVFADCTGYPIGGNWRSQYAPFTIQTCAYSSGSMGIVHQPLHPMMAGVSAITMNNYRTGNTLSTLRNPNCVCVAEYTDANRCLATYFDSAGQRAVSLGMYPMSPWIGGASGQWCRLMVNALNWAAVGPSVGVAAPNGGETWHAGSVHNITWTQTGNAVKDSVYYSTDGGSSWTGVAYYDPSPDPLEHAWTIPATPTTQARVKVVTWDEDGGRVEDKNDADFTIVVVHDVGVTQIIQPPASVDSGATVVPSAAVKNFGDAQETFPVRFNIGDFYTQDTTVTMDPGVTDTVNFPQWIAGPAGTHAVRCSTRLAPDGNNANDRAQGEVVVLPFGGIAQEESNILPLTFALHSPIPNPSASGAMVRYDLPRPALVELRIYDVTGVLVRRLVEGAQPAGYQRAYWNGRDERGRTVAPGVYYCRFKADDFLATHKMVVRR